MLGSKPRWLFASWPERIGPWLGACLLLSRPAAADESRAESLFREGRRLLSNGHLAEACDKFAESQREEPSSGALLNLARCHVDAGMTATGHGEYVAAARLARAHERPQQAAEAELRAAELAPRLMLLLIELDPKTPGAVVTRNGQQLTASELGAPIPVDPGKQHLVATAPGHATWSTTLLLAEPGQVRRVTIPALAPLPRSTDVPPASRPGSNASKAPSAAARIAELHPARTRERRPIPAATWVAGGVGTAAFVSTAALAWVAKGKWDDAHEQGLCDANHACTREGLTRTDEARRLGNLATGGAAVGVAAFASALLFYSFDRSSRAEPVRVGVTLRPKVAAIGVQGDF